MKPFRVIMAWLLGAGTIASYSLMQSSEGNAHEGWKVLFVTLVVVNLTVLTLFWWIEEFP